jgi:coproporphyrinogen III oxidase
MRKVEQIASLYSELQQIICGILAKADGKASFEENHWENEIGSGRTCVIKNGNAIEKGGVNFSFVQGKFTAQMEKLLGEKADSYSATGISSIMHPINPHVPVIHMNIRYFELDNGSGWFGGGIDLTPHYVDVSEAKAFHRQLKTICDKYDKLFYPNFKKWADDYFFLPHRHETRGVGGIFFDRLFPDRSINFEQLLSFTLDLGNAYPEIYSEIVLEKSKLAFSESEKKWQQIRRGRYVEFNLIYDRGTKFGLESGGNTESILISLPADASWEYNYATTPGSEEALTLKLLKKNIDWINFAIE